MPIPTPTKGEDRSHFMGRCMRMMNKETKKRSKKQMSAICFTQWRKHQKGASKDEPDNENQYRNDNPQ